MIRRKQIKEKKMATKIFFFEKNMFVEKKNKQNYNK